MRAFFRERMIVILLSGWSGAGKDAVASLLYPYGFQRYAFADCLKRIVSEEFGFPYHWTQTQQGKQVILSCGKRVRDVLIERGQQIREEKKDPGYFAHFVGRQILDSNVEAAVISDWRLLDELRTLEEMFADTDVTFLKVRVNREGQVRSAVNNASTENQLDNYPFDCTIENSGTSWQQLEYELKEKLKHWIHFNQ